MYSFKRSLRIALVILFVFTTSFFSVKAQMAGGTYTIGASGNYSTFAAAKLALDSGITGAVVFNILPGTYTEQIHLMSIPGSSAVNTVTFQSSTGDSSDVVLQFAGTTGGNFVVRMNNCSYITWQKITVRNTGGANGRVFDLDNQSQHITIQNCLIHTDTTLTSNTVAGIYSNGSTCYNITISNNRITGGYYGVYWNGTQTARMNKFNLTGNTIEKYYYSAAYIIYTDSMQVISNRAFNRPVTASIYYPIYVFNPDGYGLVSKNYILANGSGNSYGLRIQKAITANTSHFIVTNNMIVQANGTGTNYGISLNIVNYASILNNSVLLTSGSATGAAALHIATTSTITTSNIIVKNNNLANIGGGYAYYNNTIGAVIASDYNNLYATGANLAFWSAARTNLAALQAASLMDINSKSTNPGYFSNTDLHCNAVALWNAGTPQALVPDDFDGDLRNPLTPCIGADEFSISSNDAGIIAMATPGVACSGVTDTVKVTVKNWGLVNLTSFSVHWSVNGVPRDTVAYAGTILPGDSINLSLDTLTIYNGTIYNLVFFTNWPNGAPDDYQANDTLALVKRAALTGTHTIGSGTGYDFQSFTDAVTTLTANGVCGPVVFNAAAGTYQEQISIPNIPGTSAVNTITFSSAANDSSQVTLQYAATGTLDNYVVKLNGAQFITLKHLKIVANLTSNNTRALEITGGGSDNIITNCWIVSNTVSATAANTVYIHFDCHRNRVQNNNLQGGYHSVHLYGISTHPAKATGNLVQGNRITNYYYTAVNAGYQDSMLIHGNYCNTGFYTSSYGIQAADATGSAITANTIELSGTGYGYGIYLNDFNGTTGKPAIVANNFVVKTTGSTLYSTGIYVYTCTNIRVVNNSVHMNDSYTTSRGIYQSGGAGQHYFNNNIKVSGPGYAMYMVTPAAVDSSDYNNYITTGNYLAFWGADQSTLNDLKSVSGKETNSYNTDPFFVSGTDLHISNPFLNASGKALGYITTDIDGDVRNITTPDIGADEFNPPLNDAWVLALSSPATPVNPGISPVQVTLKNGGSNPLTAVTLHWEVNGVAQQPVNWSGNLASSAIQSNILLGNLNFVSGIYSLKIWAASPNNQVDPFPYNDTLWVSVYVFLPPLKGIYTIGATGADYPSFSQAVSALKIYGIDSTVVFKVASGTYNEQISLDTIPGISASQTVTFESAAGDSTVVILSFNSPTGSNYVVRFDGISYITFRQITISAVNPDAGYAVVFRNEAHHNTLHGNVIQSPSGNNLLSVPVYFSNQTNNNYNTIAGNRIRNGYYGIYHYGQGTTNQHHGTVIQINSITGFYHSGIYSYYADSITITGNYIESTNSATLKGIYIFNTYSSLEISHNCIILNSNAQTHGIYLYVYPGNPNQGLISNNYISVNSHNNTDFGMYIGSATSLEIVYNTVHIHGYGTSSRTFFTYSNVAMINLRNNNFTNLAEGFAFYVNTTSATMYSDRNNLYTNGINLGYYNLNITDLAMWQMYTVMLDSNSVSVDPMYLSNTSYQIASANLNGTALPYPGITTDIEGKVRHAVTPDIGAWEFTPLSQDAGVTAYIQPTLNYAVTGQPVTLEIQIRNFGTNPITSMNLGYQINNHPPVITAWTGNLLSGQMDVFLFPQTIYLPQGQTTIKAFTILPGDQLPGNDTCVLQYSAMPVLNLPYTDQFNGLQTLWGTGGSQFLWKRGVPAGNVLNNAYSAPNVWATNLSGDYGSNAEEYLYSPYFNFNNVNNATLKFFHRHITSDNSDGMQVQVSTNGGTIWTTLGFYQDPTGTNWYNTLNSGSHYFSGNSAGWTESAISLFNLNNQTSPVQFRFRFFSDGSGESEGWMIDDFKIVIPQVQTDAAMVAISHPFGTTITGSTIPVTVVVKNSGMSTISQMQLEYNLGGITQASETYNGALAPDSSVAYSFLATYQAPAGNYVLGAKVSVTGDQNSFNDSLSFTVIAVPPPFDAGITKIISPADTLTSPNPVPVEVEIRNFGTNPLTSMNVQYILGTSAAVNEVWNGTLLPGQTTLYTFTTPLNPPPGGLYNFCAKTLLANDGNPGNDELCEVKQSFVGISQALSEPFILYQNRPNPANGHTVIDFYTPQTGIATLKISNMLGQPVWEKVMEVGFGSHSVTVETHLFEPGVYFYALEIHGRKLTRKMMIAIR